MFLLLIVILDAGIGWGMRFLYFRQTSGLNQRTTYAVTQSREDVIVLGSSRAQANYVPEILAEGIGGTCYNAGRNGQSLLYAAAVSKSILARQAPRVVILDLIAADFFKYHGHYDRLSALLPYYRETPAVRPFVRLRSRFERLKLLSGIYPFNSLVLQIIRYNLVEERTDRGFVPLNGQIKVPVDPPKGRAWVRNGLDDEMIVALEALVADCVANNIRLYPVISPVYDGQAFGRDAIGVIESILAGTPYELWDFSDDPAFSGDPALFRDRDHLNFAGAKAYTAMLVESMQLPPLSDQ